MFFAENPNSKKRGRIQYLEEEKIMKFKKLVAMLLAAVMLMALVVPAMAAKPNKNKPEEPSVPAIAVDKIEDDDPRKPIVESGAKIDTDGWPAIYIKQSNDIAIIVHADDTRSDSQIIAEARASDKSLAKEGKGTTTVIKGDGRVWLHKNKTTLVTVENGILTVNGPISHASFGGNPAPEFPTEPDEPGEVSAVFTIYKYLNEIDNPGVGYIFDIIPVVNGEEGEPVGTIVSNAQGIASEEIEVLPGQYIIREQVDTDVYMPVDDVYVTVDENGSVSFDDSTFEGFITNVQWGKLEYTTPKVTEEYKEIWHKLGYEKFDVETLVAMFPSEGTPGVESNESGKAGNGFSWIGLNKAKLEELPGGVDIIISDKQKPIPYIAPKFPWEEPTAPIVNVKIDPVTKELVVTSTLQNFAVGVYNPGSVVTKPGQMTVKPSGQYNATLSLDNVENIFCLSFHVANKDGYEYKSVDSAYHTGELLLRKEISRPYTGTDLAVTVTSEDGNTTYSGDQLNKLLPGKYVVTVTVGEKVLHTQTVEVGPGETKTVTYPSDLSIENTKYHCALKNCQNHDKHDQDYYVPVTTVEP